MSSPALRRVVLEAEDTRRVSRSLADQLTETNQDVFAEGFAQFNVNHTDRPSLSMIYEYLKDQCEEPPLDALLSSRAKERLMGFHPNAQTTSGKQSFVIDPRYEGPATEHFSALMELCHIAAKELPACADRCQVLSATTVLDEDAASRELFFAQTELHMLKCLVQLAPNLYAFGKELLAELDADRPATEIINPSLSQSRQQAEIEYQKCMQRRFEEQLIEELSKPGVFPRALELLGPKKDSIMFDPSNLLPAAEACCLSLQGRFPDLHLEAVIIEKSFHGNKSLVISIEKLEHFA